MYRCSDWDWNGGPPDNADPIRRGGDDRQPGHGNRFLESTDRSGRTGKKWLIGMIPLLPLVGAGSLPAEPPVIGDSGATRPITEFVRIPTPQSTPQAPPLPSGEALAAQFLAGVFPVRTPEWTPGPVAAVAVDLRLPQPVFLIGSDPLSQQWLRRHQIRLAQAHAFGFVVNVATVEEFRALQALAGSGVPLTPASGSDLVEALPAVKLAHYPVLISSRMIEQ